MAKEALVYQAAKAGSMFGSPPAVARMRHGDGINAGPQHSQCLEAGWWADCGVGAPSMLDPFRARSSGNACLPNPLSRRCAALWNEEHTDE